MNAIDKAARKVVAALSELAAAHEADPAPHAGRDAFTRALRDHGGDDALQVGAVCVANAVQDVADGDFEFVDPPVT